MVSKEMLKRINEKVKLPSGYYFGVNEINCNVVTLYNENREELAEYTLSDCEDATIAKMGLMLEEVFSKLS